MICIIIKYFIFTSFHCIVELNPPLLTDIEFIVVLLLQKLPLSVHPCGQGRGGEGFLWAPVTLYLRVGFFPDMGTPFLVLGGLIPLDPGHL